MLDRLYPGQVCSIARTLEVVGERWTLLVLRDAFLGLRRFDEFSRSLGIARNILSARLQVLCDNGILERHRYQERPERFEYLLTDKGRELEVALDALMQWGDRYLAPKGPPKLMRHRGCDGQVTVATICKTCGRPLASDEVETIPGPGHSAAAAVAAGGAVQG
ncbi:MAG: helix-turn-helix transcriptional regulator [Actinobacteria bacterium]|nr:helix-turn-helix transcriptional regulator [Actinomycetota bacterium]